VLESSIAGLGDVPRLMIQALKSQRRPRRVCRDSLSLDFLDSRHSSKMRCPIILQDDSSEELKHEILGVDGWPL